MKKTSFVIKFHLTLLLLTIVGCTKTPAPKISTEQYKEQSKLMLGICEKLSNERDAHKLNAVTKDIELSRIVSCHRVVGECDLYSKFLTAAVRVSEDGVLDPSETIELKNLRKNLEEETNKGQKQLEKNP